VDARTSVAVTTCANFEVERAVYFVLFGAMDSSQSLRHYERNGVEILLSTRYRTLTPLCLVVSQRDKEMLERERSISQVLLVL